MAAPACPTARAAGGRWMDAPHSNAERRASRLGPPTRPPPPAIMVHAAFLPPPPPPAPPSTATPTSPLRLLHVYCSIHGGCPILGGGCATSLSHGYHEPDEEPMRPGRKTERATQTICAGPVEAFARGPGAQWWRDRGTGYKRRRPPRIGTHLSLTPKTPDKVSISPTPSLLSL